MSAKKKINEREALRQTLHERGVQLTSQRAAVFEYLSGVAHHPTAEEIYLAIKPKLPRISLATVYKNLEALARCEVVSKLTYGDAAARYDIRTDHHYHTRCLECSKIWDLNAAEGSAWLEQVKPQAGFEVHDYRLEILGRCRDCRRRR